MMISQYFTAKEILTDSASFALHTSNDKVNGRRH